MENEDIGLHPWKVELLMYGKPIKPNAFSLLELLAVVAILGFLASILVPRVTTSANVAKEKTCFHNRAVINSAVERWYMDTESWPAADLSDIGVDTDYFPDGVSSCPVSGTDYQLDVTTHRVIGHNGAGKGGGHN